MLGRFDPGRSQEVFRQNRFPGLDKIFSLPPMVLKGTGMEDEERRFGLSYVVNKGPATITVTKELVLVVQVR